MTGAILVNDNQIARLEEDNGKTELAVEETISQSKPQLQNTDVGTSHQDEDSAATSAAEPKHPEPPANINKKQKATRKIW